MDKINKFLRRLSRDESRRVFAVMESIRSGNVKGLDVKKLRGRNEQFRARVGDIRIIFNRDNDGTFHLLSIDRRNDTTYR